MTYNEGQRGWKKRVTEKLKVESVRDAEADRSIDI